MSTVLNDNTILENANEHNHSVDSIKCKKKMFNVLSIGKINNTRGNIFLIFYY